jgi:alpha-galactosidase/6-phospho-beta-glucosidase family protein
MTSRQQFSPKEKQWWIDEYTCSNFNTYGKFLSHATYQSKLKSGDLYEKIKKHKYNVPKYRTFKTWFMRSVKTMIERNKESNRLKQRPAKSQELDQLLVLDYIVESVKKLSEYGLGLSWAIVKDRASEFSIQLNDQGLMSNGV